MAKKNIYSILIKNNFKAPNTHNDMFFRGYFFYFIRNVLEGQESQDAFDATHFYTDEQYRKLLQRLKDNGHVL